MRTAIALAAAVLACAAVGNPLPAQTPSPAPAPASQPAVALIQDFEELFELTVLPGEGLGSAGFSTEWKSDGAQSLKIEPGVLASFADLSTKDWRGYQVLRFHVRNTAAAPVNIQLELSDRNPDPMDRYVRTIGVPAGEKTVEIDLNPYLWRGPEISPWRGRRGWLELNRMARIGVRNLGRSAVFVDQFELAKAGLLAGPPGAFAFDFSRKEAPSMPQLIAINEDTMYTPQRGYGIAGKKPFSWGEATPFPTAMLGGGLPFNAGGFRVDLPGGDYIGWIAFERAGYSPDHNTGYMHAMLKVNGAAVHEHDFSPWAKHFFFQDTEITDISRMTDKLLWPAGAVGTFKFKAANGGNTFTVECREAVEQPLRVAGLFVAPDTAEGRAFIDAQEKLQRKVIADTFFATDLSRRGQGTAVVDKPLVCQALPVGQVMYPGDWPTIGGPAAPEEIYALAGQVATVNLGVYANKEAEFAVVAGKLAGPGAAELPAPAVSHGRYMPMRGPYGSGLVWCEVNHYRPGGQFTAGPNMSRSVILEYNVPAGTPGGAYAGAVRIQSAGATLDVPIKVHVVAAELPPIPIPVGLLNSALPFGTDMVSDETWWSLQEAMLAEEARAGLNCPTGGRNLYFGMDRGGGKYKVAGETPLKYLKLAQKYNGAKAVVGVAGFMPRIDQFQGKELEPAAAAMAAFEQANQLPPQYVQAYDEPSYDDECRHLVKVVTPATKTGMKTFGFISRPGTGPQADQLIDNTYAPCMSACTEQDIRKLKAAGKHPWVCNSGLDRYSIGLQLWRQIQAGVEGRLESQGMLVYGFAFDELDGREPSRNCFGVHKDLGLLKTPRWIAAREGLIDLRVRLALEKLAPAGDPALALWKTDGYAKDRKDWTDGKLDQTRQAMIKRIEELAKK
ncbi:MAG: hypothetical protein ACE15C_05025 [Phycisphaerae bacterium]